MNDENAISEGKSKFDLNYSWPSHGPIIISSAWYDQNPVK